jgi:hypothetical protein
MVYGKIFRKPFSIFSFNIFRSKDKYFPLTFDFTAKQTLINDKNILRKIFYIETNGAYLIKVSNHLSWDFSKANCHVFIFIETVAPYCDITKEKKNPDRYCFAKWRALRRADHDILERLRFTRPFL